MEKTAENQQAITLLQKFTTEQCCGKCVSCREGSRQMLQLLSASDCVSPDQEAMQLLTDLDELIEHTARCGLGIYMAHQVLAILLHKGDQGLAIEDYIPGPYQDLLFFQIDAEKCRGCSRCAKRCPVKAVSGEIKKSFVIDKTKCIKCGTCLMNCKMNAITIKD